MMPKNKLANLFLGIIFVYYYFMKKELLLLFVITFSMTKSFAQLSATEEKYLAEIMLKKINFLRKKAGTYNLKQDKNLAKAAHYHSDYMSNKYKVTHYQLEKEYVTPEKRIRKFSDDFNVFGENVLKTRSIKPPFTKKKLGLIANYMLNSWRKSPKHYQNIISNQFSHADFGFVYHTKKRQIFATNVFGNKSLKIPNQLSENSFGIIDNFDCSSIYKYQNILINMGNDIQIIDDEIIFSYHNKENLKNIFTNKLDGFAVDIVTKDQIKCGIPNRLDSSPVYDGILLKPVYRDAIFSNNKAVGDYRLIVSLGKIPEHLKGKELNANLIILKNNGKCDYRVPVSIPFSKYSLIPIKPNIYTPNISLKTEGSAFVKEIFFDFNSSKTSANKISQVKLNKKQITSIDIKSYTSVDGSYKNNNYLFNKRAKFIKDYLNNSLKLNSSKINIEAKENWELFDFQLELDGYDTAVNKSKKEKRYLANNTLKNNFVNEFTNQRKSKAIIFEKDTWKTTDQNHAYFNLIEALLNNNTELANKALSELYKQEETQNILSQDFILDRLIHQKELVLNTSALIAKNIHHYQIDSIIYYINYWLKRYDNLSIDTQRNLLNLYIITAEYLLSFWDLDKERLARVLHPTKVEGLFESIIIQKQEDPLYLNYHMAIIKYYGQTNEYDKIYFSFNFITNYFKKRITTIEDNIKLALFFNSWSRYDLTLDLLHKAYLNDKLNEEGIFIFAKTLVAYPYMYDEITQEDVQELAAKSNLKKWCNWINNDFQNLRLQYIKDIYCKQCK